jgi:hypothetical protein
VNFVDVNQYLANVAQKVRKCPTPTLRHAYMRAYREWCQQTQWLRTNIDGATVVDQRQYSLGQAPGLDVIGIYAMQGSQNPGNGIKYWPIVKSDSEYWDPNLSINPATTQPIRYAYIPEGQFALDPIPKGIFGLTVTAIVTPSEDSVNVPLEPLIKYSNDIEAGALAYLYDINDQPWTNPGLALKNDRIFASGVSNGKAEVQRNYNTGSQRARPRMFLIR